MIFGVDQVESSGPLLDGGRVALLTSITGRSSRNESTISVLQRLCNLTCLLAPEHGVRGDRGPGVGMEDSVDPATGLPVYSLYTKDSKHLSQRVLDTFDILVYDIQDVGLRFYTFISSLYNVMQDCAASGKRLVVLDRPNPLGGVKVEGGLLQRQFRSFVGCCEIPVRYGLSIGEFAGMVNSRENLGCDLQIVPCTGWHRESFPHWGRIWQMPSMALATYQQTLLYAGTCLFEGTALSEGRGTSAPFRIIGGPEVDGERISGAFNRLELPGVAATPVYFNPTCSKHCGTLCGGLMLHVTDEQSLQPVRLGVELLDLFQRLYPDQSRFLPPADPEKRPFISLLTGCGDFAPGWDKEEILARYAAESRAFAAEKKDYHLYQEDTP
ncbi:MAG: DUF1343 domain-containing protein [Eubacteriales bacterium]|nr:DUF1343 domain-containing protein [Eubacteriales bacterium]